MDFNELMNIAASKQETLNKHKNLSKYKYNLEFPAPKKEEKSKPKSAVLISLLKEKEKEREAAEKVEREKVEEEKKRNQFRIPKKKVTAIDRETLINSLFEDENDECEQSSSSHPAPSSTSEKHSSNHVTKDSHSRHEKNNCVKKQEHSEKQHNSIKNEKHKSDKSTTAEASKKLQSQTSHSSSLQPSKPQTASNVSNNTKNVPNENEKKGITSSHAEILAKLEAIKQRTREALQKENASKGNRSKRERSHKKTSKSDEKLDDKAKSVEIIKDDYDSEDESEAKAIPSALDIMLLEHNAKLEKGKISRMAKQAWERATKQQMPDEKEEKKKKKRTNSKEIHSYKHKSKDKNKASHSLPSKGHTDNVKHKKIIKSSNNGPPPMDFKTILAIAEKKQKEPQKTLQLAPKKKEEERPLTQEEKDRRERQKSKEYQKWLQQGGQRPGVTSETKGAACEDKTAHKLQTVQNKSPALSKPPPSNGLQTSAKGHIPSKNMTVNENILVCGPGKEKDNINPFDRIIQTVHKKRPGSQQKSEIPAKKQMLDSEEEEESDLDSFIDDGDFDMDYSSEIQKMFGYNRNKYKDEDEDISDMESDFKTVMMEEKRSAKLGLQEDLEDIKKEQEELRLKAMRKKMLKSGR